MAVAADIVRSTAEWYRPIVSPKDMREHAVDDRWGSLNYLRREFYVGCFGEDIMGILSIQHCGEYLYLGYLYLREETIGKGLGQQFLSFSEDAGRERGYRGLVLIAHPKAYWAVKAYRRFGFEPWLTEREHVLSWNEGFLRPYYEEDFTLFRYPLTDH